MPVKKMDPPPPSPKKKSRTKFMEFSKYDNPPGRVRYLKFDINALADFEQETGMGFAQLMKQKAVFASARAMLWAGLKHEDRTLTMEDVGNLLGQYLKDPDADDHSINDILTVAVTAAVEQDALGRLPVVKEENEDEDEIEADAKQPLLPNVGEVIDLPAGSVETSNPTTTTPATDD